MASYFPAKKNTAYIIYVALESVATAGAFQTNPTLASGDFKVSIDGGSLANLTTLPTVTPTAGKMVKISLSSAEMNGDNITIVCSDASGGEWKDLVLNLQTTANQIDDLATPTNITAAAGITLADGAITAAKIASDAITDAKIADGAIDAATFAAGAINAAAIATDAIGAAEIAADAVTKIQNGLATATNLATVAGYIDTEIQSIIAAIAALNDLSVADVNAQVLDVLITDTFAEPSSPPAATSSIKDKINWVAALARNKITQTATTTTLRNDADSGNIATSTVSDNGTTFTKGEWA